MKAIGISATCALAAAFGLLGLAGCKKEVVREEPIRPVRTITVGDVGPIAGRPFPGQAQANEEVDLSFRVAGTLADLPVKVGDVVKPGQVLAKLDPRDFEVKIRAAEGELAATKANLELAKVELTRMEDMFKNKVASQIELDRAQRLVEVQKGNLESWTSRRDAAKDDLSYAQLTAPFAGTIVSKYVDNFQTVQVKQPVYRLLETSKVKFVIDLPEAGMPLLPNVKEITVTFPALKNLKLPAKIHEVAREASRATRTYRVTVIMDQPADVQIIPGMTGELRAVVEKPSGDQQKGTDVLATALFDAGKGETAVWILDKSSMTVKKQAVKTIRPSATGYMVEGLAPGQTVVTAGVHYLKEGQKVRALETAPTTAPAGGSVAQANGASSKLEVTR